MISFGFARDGEKARKRICRCDAHRLHLSAVRQEPQSAGRRPDAVGQKLLKANILTRLYDIAGDNREVSRCDAASAGLMRLPNSSNTKVDGTETKDKRSV